MNTGPKPESRNNGIEITGEALLQDKLSDALLRTEHVVTSLADKSPSFRERMTARLDVISEKVNKRLINSSVLTSAMLAVPLTLNYINKNAQGLDVGEGAMFDDGSVLDGAVSASKYALAAALIAFAARGIKEHIQVYSARKNVETETKRGVLDSLEFVVKTARNLRVLKNVEKASGDVHADFRQASEEFRQPFDQEVTIVAAPYGSLEEKLQRAQHTKANERVSQEKSGLI